MYNLAIRKCTSLPLLAPRLKIFKLKFTIPPIPSKILFDRRLDKISMLVKYNKTCIDSSSFVNIVKVNFWLRTPRVFLFTEVASNNDLEQVSICYSFIDKWFFCYSL